MLANPISPVSTLMPFGQPMTNRRPVATQSGIVPPSSAQLQNNINFSHLANLRLPFFKPPQSFYRFALIGDAGTGDAAQTAVARQMSLWHQMFPFNSVMVLGDNIYPDGDPSLFQTRIAKPYGPLLQEGVQFYPVLGNHDVKKGFGNWQLAFWGVPPYYSFKLGPKGSEVEFFAIDTNLFTPGVDEEGQVEEPQTRQKAACQWQWLKQALASSTAPMKVVYGHHPMHSRGAAAKPIRNWQQNILAQTLEPLLTHYGVDLYMSGHEHHYEKPAMVNGMYHLVSGAAGKLDSPKRGGREGNGLIKQLHFMLFDITPQGLAYRTIGHDGRCLDYGVIPRKHPGDSNALPSASVGYHALNVSA